MTQAPLLALVAAEPGYRGRAILPPLSLEVRRGEVWALVGRNGAGKSTLLRTLVGSLPLVRGSLAWLPGVRASAVPQRGDLDLGVPMRARDMVAAGADRGWSFLNPWPGATVRTQIRDAMLRTECQGLARLPFAELSEGQKQRVMMARALVSRPDVLILDEPTSAMDPANEGAIFKVLEALRAEQQVAILIASHHPQVVPQLADHALFLDRDDGQAVAGPVAQVLAHPAFLKRYGSIECFHGHWEPAPEAP